MKRDRDARSRRCWALVLILVAPILFAGCADGGDDVTDTATIAPATPEPNMDVENDPALTRTVDPGEDRSPYEGGPLGDDEVVGGEPRESGPPGPTPGESEEESHDGTL